MRFGLRHIRYFIAVAEDLHFRRAAERLGVAQPALSRAIKTLEAELGATLFNRTNRNVEITQAGQSFLTGCRSVMITIERTAEDARRAHLGEIGTLRIGYTDMAIAGALPQILTGFQSARPGIVLRPVHGVTSDQLKKMESGELDIGFLTGPINRKNLEQIPVQSERLVCATYENHPLSSRRSIRLEELADEDFVLGSSTDWVHFRAYLLPLCRRAGFVPRVVQEAFNTAGILGLVACGMGSTVLTESVCAALPKGLVVVPLEDVDEHVKTVAVWRSGDDIGPLAHFVDFVRQNSSAPG